MTRERAPHPPAPGAREPRARRRLVRLLALALALLAARGARADDLADRFSRARFKEVTERQFEQALGIYDALAAEEGASPGLRGNALLGAARCHLQLGDPHRAEVAWDRILADPTMPASVREAAERARAEQAGRGAGVDETEIRDLALRRQEEQRREQARALLQQARLALGEGRYDHAHRLCLDALSTDPDSEEARTLLATVLRAMPDRGELLRNLIDFVHTTRLHAFQRLKADVYLLERDGRRHFQAGELTWADERFRRAIELIDQSEFLVELADERGALLRWLRLTIEEGRKQDLDLADPPPLPDPAQQAPSYRRRFFDLLSELFTRGPDEESPLEIYDLAPPPHPREATRATLVPGPFPEGVSVRRAEGGLHRAAWAEGWIRSSVGTGWPEDGGRPGSAPRILERFGDLLVVQNTPTVQRQVREALAAFRELPSPLAVDVAVLATDVAGGTRVAAALGLRPSAREDGYAAEIPGRLIEEVVPDVEAVEGVRLLGTFRLVLADVPTATVEVTARSDAHPAYEGLPAPVLLLSEAESRYGLWLEVYAEDMTNAPRAALAVRAETRTPVGTVVIPEPGAPDQWRRIAQPMARQEIGTDRVLPHVGTLLLTGLRTPFPGIAEARPNLVLLLGVRPGVAGSPAAPVPDPPRAGADGRTPTGEEREYDLGALGFEVEDAVLLEGWPQRPASVPVLPEVQRRAREEYLAERLGVAWTHLVEPGEANPVEVVGPVARARLDPARHARLEQAVQRLRDQEGLLYEVDVVAVETDEEQLAEWLRLGRVQAFTPGTYLGQDPEGLEALDARMRAQEPTGSLYTTRSRVPVRATQRIAVTRLETQTIVEDVRIARAADGSPRYVPQHGLAEEGLVVLVRPELDDAGRRLVIVDARAAEIEALDAVLLPGVEESAARVQVPRHFPVQRRQAAAPLTDAQALVLTLPAPAGTGRAIVVKVTVRRVP